MNYGVGPSPNDIASGDLNGDGFADIVTANQGASSISVLLSNGSGALSAAVAYNVQNNPASISIADINRDGRLDLVTADYGASGLGSTASILYGNGDGTFQPFTTTTLGIGPIDLEIVDTNNDGINDILALLQSSTFSSGNFESSSINPVDNGYLQQDNVTFQGTPVREVTTISAVAAGQKEETQITLDDASTINSGDYFTISTPNNDYYVWFNVDGAGGDPGLSGIGIEVAITSTELASDVAGHVEAALVATGDFDISTAGATVTATSKQQGVVTDAANGSVGGAFSIATSVQGTNSAIAPGDHFLLSSWSTNYYVWFTVGGEGANPFVPGRTGIQINLNYGDSAATVASTIASTLEAHADFISSAAGSTITITNELGGSATNASTGTVGAPFNVTTTVNGADTNIRPGRYFTIDTPGSDHYIWFRVNGAGTDPALAGRTGHVIDLNWGDSSTTVATAVQSVVDALAETNASRTGATVTITGALYGPGSIGAGTVAGLSITTLQNGQTPPINSGDYFTIDTPTTDFFVWYRVDGAGGPPSVPGRTGVMVDIASGSTVAQISTATANALNATGFFNAVAGGAGVNVTTLTQGDTPNATNINLSGFSVGATANGVDPDINLVTDTVNSTHSYFTGQAVQLLTSGSLPGGLSTGTTYYLIAGPGTLRFASSQANALANIAINLTGYGTGVQTVLASTASGSSSLGSGNGAFSAFAPFPAGTSPTQLVTADVNRDGIPDVIIGEGVAQAVQVALGKGDGSFYAPNVYSTLGNAQSIGLGDFNQDGRLDIAATHSTNGVQSAVSILLGNGNGTFANAYSVTAGTAADMGASRLQVSDLNDDGISDIILSNNNGGAGSTVSVILGNGDGTFKAPTSFNTGAGTFDSVATDLNGDGVLDLVSANKSGSVSALIQNTTLATTAPILDISNQLSARQAMDRLVQMSDRVHAEAAQLGAFQSRIEVALEAAFQARQGTEEAASQILDVDVAQESSSFIRATLLQKSTANLLRNAHSVDAGIVLRLLKDGDE